MSTLKSKKQFVIVALFLLMFLAVAPFPSTAAGLVPCGGPGEHFCTVLDAFYMVALVTNWLLMVVGLYAFYQIVNHGFWLVVTMGNEESISTHRKGITNAIVGMAMALFAYVFVNTAVNTILASKCQINLKSPLDYVVKPCTPNPDAVIK